MTKPMIISLNGTPSGKAGASQAVTSGTASALSAFSAAVDRLPIPQPDLLNFVRARYAIAYYASGRASWALGRWFNKVSGQDPDYTVLSGAHLVQVLAAAGFAPPEGVQPTGSYKLRVDVVKQAMDRLVSAQDKDIADP